MKAYQLILKLIRHPFKMVYVWDTRVEAWEDILELIYEDDGYSDHDWLINLA